MYYIYYTYMYVSYVYIYTKVNYICKLVESGMIHAIRAKMNIPKNNYKKNNILPYKKLRSYKSVTNL